MANLNKVSFAHGLKANAENAVATGKIDRDDFIIFSDTDDELAFVDHEGSIHPIKARTNEEIIINDSEEAVGPFEAGYSIPAGTSLDEYLQSISELISNSSEYFSQKTELEVIDWDLKIQEDTNNG